MEEGSLRCDANVSVHREGEPWGVRVEVQNLNSFRNVQRALEHEIARQAALLDAGGKVEKQSRLWDANAGETRAMRSKEDEQDYRYFPEPDLPPLRVDEAAIETVRAALPELPAARKARFLSELGLPEPEAHLLTLERPLADWFEAVVAAGRTQAPRSAAGDVARETAKWVVRDVLARAKDEKIDSAALAGRFPAARLAAIIGARLKGEITAASAAEVFESAWTDGREPADVIRERGLAVISDSAAVESLVVKVLEANPAQVAQYRAGKAAVFGFLVGQVMKAAAGKASPDQVNALLRKALDEPR
jgi:aspartyl-tRNA(Asn)/glutamyl-tRNA(Gln) amidotransferase subunit B